MFTHTIHSAVYFTCYLHCFVWEEGDGVVVDGLALVVGGMFAEEKNDMDIEHECDDADDDAAAAAAVANDDVQR